MRTIKNIAAAIATTITLLVATPAVAADHGGRDVRINEENFAKLAPEDQQRVLAIKVRLEELIATDRSTLSTSERVALRSEWKELKREMRAQNDGGHGSVLYISTGALIIIILLLIILL
ncbi:MAG: hypothetical protein ABI432_09505 [Flavobacteriales bacterium]